jgi:O-antigen/teichoic acid export membrane protein
MKALLSAILSKAGGAVFTLALVAYLGHAIGPEASGYFYFTLAVAVMLSQLLRLGMDGVVLRLASRYHHAGDTDALQRFCGDMLVYLVCCGAIMVLLGKLLEGYAAPLLFAGEAPHLLYETALYSFVPFTLMWTSAALLKGIGKTSLSVFIEAGSVPLTCCSDAAGDQAEDTAKRWRLAVGERSPPCGARPGVSFAGCKSLCPAWCALP